nr:hypothetical protein [Myxococcota bacterium]
GEDLVVVGEPDEAATPAPGAARYHVGRDAWSAVDEYGAIGPTVIWTGAEVVAWGGYDGTNLTAAGWRRRP